MEHKFRKGLAVGIICIILGTTFFSASATDHLVSLISEEKKSRSFLYDNLTGILTHGPFMPLFNIATINLTDGDPEQIAKIKQMLNNRILQLILLEQEADVTGLDFSVTYNFDIPRPQSLVGGYIFMRFGYVTSIGYGDNSSSIGYVKHTVIVKGFEGKFSIGRPPFPFRLFPPRFAFVGDCKEVEVIT